MEEQIKSYDFCIAWEWEHDSDIVVLFGDACRSRNISLMQITPHNLEYSIESLFNNRTTFWAFLDRASDTDRRFVPVVQWASNHPVFCINPHELASQAVNKASMHHALINAGLNTPHTIILPAYNEQQDLPPLDLSCLGERFNIKPAHGGGGEGVVKEATTWSRVLSARKEYPSDRYLLQAHIVPNRTGFLPSWFRVIYCTGQIYPCWWDPQTHIYSPVGASEERDYNLTQLRGITASIASICKLQLFSTEIALTGDGNFIVVDYVNDQIDLRLKSKAFDGVPDEIVQDIVFRLVDLVKQHSLTF